MILFRMRMTSFRAPHFPKCVLSISSVVCHVRPPRKILPSTSASAHKTTSQWTSTNPSRTTERRDKDGRPVRFYAPLTQSSYPTLSHINHQQQIPLSWPITNTHFRRLFAAKPTSTNQLTPDHAVQGQPPRSCYSYYCGNTHYTTVRPAIDTPSACTRQQAARCPEPCYDKHTFYNIQTTSAQQESLLYYVTIDTQRCLRCTEQPSLPLYNKSPLKASHSSSTQAALSFTQERYIRTVRVLTRKQNAFAAWWKFSIPFPIFTPQPRYLSIYMPTSSPLLDNIQYCL